MVSKQDTGSYVMAWDKSLWQHNLPHSKPQVMHPRDGALDINKLKRQPHVEYAYDNYQTTDLLTHMEPS